MYSYVFECKTGIFFIESILFRFENSIMLIDSSPANAKQNSVDNWIFRM